MKDRSRSSTSIDALDLFAQVRTAPTREAVPQPLPPKLPSPEQLATLSDRDLSELMALVADELHRRVAVDKSGCFIARAIARLAAMTPPMPKSRPARKQEARSILDGKRNAIRAALKAGLRPAQVPRHFGVSLSDVRQVAAQAD
jgi:hypothetical protein